MKRVLKLLTIPFILWKHVFGHEDIKKNEIIIIQSDFHLIHHKGAGKNEDSSNQKESKIKDRFPHYK